jgi:hypothetical protein
MSTRYAFFSDLILYTLTIGRYSFGVMTIKCVKQFCDSRILTAESNPRNGQRTLLSMEEGRTDAS